MKKPIYVAVKPDGATHVLMNQKRTMFRYFNSYDAARNALRRHIRSLYYRNKRLSKDGTWGELFYRNPSISRYPNYEIRRVEQARYTLVTSKAVTTV